MTTNDIYQQIKNAVMYYPANAKKCLQPQAFRVLTNEAHLTAANLGVIPKEKNTPFFFSRAWAANKYNPNAIVYDYPLVVATRLNRNAQKVAQKDRVFTSELRVQIGVIDRVADDCKGCDPEDCAARTVEQVKQDTEQMLINVIEYLSSVNLYDVDGLRTYDVPGRIDALKRAGQIREYQIVRRGVMLKPEYSLTIEQIDPLAGTTGSAVILTFQLAECQSVDFDFSGVNDDTSLVYSEGCTNCGN